MKLFKPVWYTTPDFLKLNKQNVFHKENTSIAIKNEITNYHILARSTVIHKKGEAAILQLTADDYYKLYINGKYVCQGPAPAYHTNYFYNELDISEFLDEGENILAVHLYYQGLINRVWQSGDNRFGIGAVLNGTSLKWKYVQTKAFSGHINGYDTEFAESFDSRLWYENWNKADFDDSDFMPMIECECDYTFVRQKTKMLDVYELEPRIIKENNNSIFIDIGFEIAGGLKIKAVGSSGDTVIIRCGEELNNDGSVRYKLRANCTYEEKWILADGECTYENYLYKGFRYAEIQNKNADITDIKIICRHYPFDDDYCKISTADKKINDIFNLCKSTIKYSVQESYIDCPTREKGQYLGDAFIAAHSHLLLTGDGTLLEKCIDDFAQSAQICSGLMAVSSCSFMQEIADYSLLFGELLLLAYEHNQDKAFLQKYYDATKNVILHFKRFEREDGLLNQVSDKWNLVDWPENLRDDYDFGLTRPIVADGVHNVMNAFYIGAVCTLNRIERILGTEASFDLKRLKDAYTDTFLRESNLFADSEYSNHCSLHSNVFALYFGLVPDYAAEEVCSFIAEKGLSCGVYVSYFLLRALAGQGRYDDVYRLLTNESEHGWINMLREGATTCFEVWGKEQKFNTSLCHPWATAPIPIILEDLKITED